MALAPASKRNFALAAFLSLFLSLFSVTTEPAFAAPAGTLTISDSGSDSLPAPSSGVYDIQSNITVDPADIEAALISGNVTLWATSITVSSDIDGPNTNSLTLKSTSDITVQAGVGVTNQGGDLIFWADSDATGGANLAGGAISIAAGSNIDTGTGGGDIVLAGGSDSDTDGVPDGYAYGAIAAGTEPWSGAGGTDGTAGIMLKSATLDAGTGSLVIRGQGTGDKSGNFQTGLWLEGSTTRAAAVTIAGNGSRNGNSGSSNWGVLLLSTTVESPGTIDIEGRGGTATSGSRTNQHGVVMAPPTGTPSRVEATGAGSVVINGFGGGAAGVGDGVGILLYNNQTIQSDSGDITLEGTTGTKGGFGAIWLMGGLSSTTGDINLVGNKNSSGGGGVTFNTASAVSGTLTIESPSSVAQTGAISASAVSISGPGSVTLTNSSNAIGTLAAGTSLAKVGSVSIFDASGGLTIGKVGSLEGVWSTGDVLIETGTGDITLARSIATDSTSGDAIILNAGKSAAAGTASGGDIVVSGSPTLTTGAGAIVKMFSGTDSASTGLTALVGGASNTYTGVDETSTLSPAPVNGTKYALYRSTPTSGGSSGGSSGSSSSSDTPVTPVTPTPAVRPGVTSVNPVTPNTDPVSKPVERSGVGFDPDAPARATIGGIATPLIEVPGGPDGFSFTAGAFQFGVTVNGANGGGADTDTPSSSRELFVPSGQPAVVSGGGSYPGSFVQLWLPGNNGTEPREISRIQVGPDGRFGSDLTFDGPSSGSPVPIGRQVLQVVGFDEEGNQTVVDMTINIGQGAPAPEPNRQVGELPALSAGQSLATSGGMPQDVSVTGLPEAGNVVVEGPDWVVNVNADRDNGVVETDEGRVLVRLDQSSVGTTSGSGFMAGTLASVWLFSEPTLMATVTVDDNGEFSSEFLVDARLIAPGEHTLQVQGVGQDGLLKAANLGVVVEQPAQVTPQSASGLLWWVLGLFLVVLFVVLFFLIARRRRQNEA